MHGYPLFREIEVDCVCCNMPTWFNFKSASDHVVCKACLRHVGDTVGKLRLRDQDHRGLWASDVALLREQLSAERLGNAQKTTELEGQIRALNLVNEGLQSTVLDGFSKAAPADVQSILSSREVQTANDERDGAFRSRDRAMRVIWALDGLHHQQDRDEALCSCGSRYESCKVSDALEGIREQLYTWESRQIERAEAGRPHGLPREHPKYRDRDYY